MAQTTLTADGGSTKTAWRLDGLPAGNLRLTTRGLNPSLMEEADLAQIIRRELLPRLGTARVGRICYYGAGCRAEGSRRMERVLRGIWPEVREVMVGSDIVGAARALFGTDGDGIACILGTGSNSGLYLGGEIRDNVPPLGFILGDEGSGAVLGRRLAGDVLKRQLPPEICTAFLSEYGLTADSLIERVYRHGEANRFLASFVPFLAQRRTACPALHALVLEEFRRFFRRNVAPYRRPDLAVGFVGGVAYTFQPELAEAARAEGFILSRILREPLD